MKIFETTTTDQTKKIGQKIAEQIKNDLEKNKTPFHAAQGAAVICLSGDLGAGKTTFTQGLLEELGAEGPYTSPTFAIMKEYNLSNNNGEKNNLKTAYHIDTYRIESKDILELDWNEIISNPGNVVIVEWAERIRDIIPENATWINFEWISENERKITFVNEK